MSTWFTAISKSKPQARWFDPLLASPFSYVQTKRTKPNTEFSRQSLLAVFAGMRGNFIVPDIANKLGRSSSSAARWVNAALDHDIIEVVAPVRGNKPAVYRVKGAE